MKLYFRGSYFIQSDKLKAGRLCPRMGWLLSFRGGLCQQLLSPKVPSQRFPDYMLSHVISELSLYGLSFFFPPQRRYFPLHCYFPFCKGLNKDLKVLTFFLKGKHGIITVCHPSLPCPSCVHFTSRMLSSTCQQMAWQNCSLVVSCKYSRSQNFFGIM